jgi:hypothetical protein
MLKNIRPTSVILKELLEVNNRPIGENSPKSNHHGHKI